MDSKSENELRELLEKEIKAHAVTAKELERVQNQFQALMSNSLDAMGLFDKDFNVLYRNPAAQRISGWTDQDFEQNPPITNIHPDDLDYLKGKLAEALKAKDEPVHVSYRSRHKQGHYLWVEGTFRNMLEDPVQAIVLSIRDVTSRKSAEQIAATSEADLNTIFENMSEGIVMMDSDGTIRLFNKNAIRLASVGTGKMLTIGDNIKNYIDTPRKDFFEHVEQLIKAGKNFDYDRQVTVNGAHYWINVTINPILQSGNLMGICMVTRDITSRKEAELKTAESEEQFRTLIERISDAFISFDKDLRYTYVNQKAGEITHKDPKELIGRYVWDVFPDAIGSSTYEAFNKAISDQVYLCNTDYFEPLNLWQENHLYPSENGLSVFIRDISERKRSEKKLVESEQRFRTLIENSSDAILLADENLKVIYQSPSVERITGISLEYRRANPNTTFSHPDDQPVIAEVLKNAKRNPGIPEFFQIRLHHIDAKNIWIEGFVTNQLNDPNVRALVFNYRDVSERKKSEAEILNLNNELEEKVIQRTEQLEALNKELESFTYSVSHDLRAPLRIIDGFSQIVLEDFGDKLDASGKKNLTVIVNNARRMGMLIDDLLNFSKIGKAQLRISEVNMNLLVHEVIEELRMSQVQIPEGVKINNLKPGNGDASLLKQVWINLISNAIKYSSKKENPEIEIGAYEEDKRTVFYVKDNGAGFDMQYAHKLFGVFQRLHKFEEFTGTGVGLALVQRIIARHEGTVWAEGKLNEGAIFYFALPQ